MIQEKKEKRNARKGSARSSYGKGFFVGWKGPGDSLLVTVREAASSVKKGAGKRGRSGVSSSSLERGGRPLLPPQPSRLMFLQGGCGPVRGGHAKINTKGNSGRSETAAAKSYPLSPFDRWGEQGSEKIGKKQNWNSRAEVVRNPFRTSPVVSILRGAHFAASTTPKGRLRIREGETE